jgi:DNA-binding NtrC family response regulator
VSALPPRRERLVLIDDDPGLSEVIELLLEREGYAVQRAGTVKRGIELAATGEFELVITDLRLPDGTGLDAIAAIRASRPELPIIMITSYSSMESAIAALRAGAIDYIIKPFDNDEFLHSIRRALNERRMQRENLALRRNVRTDYDARRMVGESPGMRRVQELARKVAASGANVLINGESGSGKELVALSIHFGGAHAERPFLAVDCGATPRETLEEEIFGHAARGLGGTLYLDEVGELSAELQLRLMRLLEDKRPSELRFIASTQRNLPALAERGQFRKDLYYRLSVISIDVPPLRERGEDALLLARRFAAEHARRLGKTVAGFDAEFESFIAGYGWPGNVRELENLVERAVILAEGDTLTGRDLAEVAPALPMVRAASPLPGGGRPLAIEEYVREVIERFQDTHSETELARMLGIGRKALWMRRRQWGLKRTRKSAGR